MLVADSSDGTPMNNPANAPQADRFSRRGLFRWLIGGSIVLGGCRSVIEGNPVDPPFVLGQATDAFWDAQQTNAEAADFIFYDHEFRNETAEFTPAGWDHLLQVAVRLPHVPFPVVIERYENNYKPSLDARRRATVLAGLAQVGVVGVDQRVVIAPAFAPGLTSDEAESAYNQSLLGGSNSFIGGGTNGGRGGRGGFR